MVLLTMAVGLCLLGQPVIADTIYTWTDADGVKRYSNSQPPDDAENVQTIQEIEYDQAGDDRTRQEFDRMVEDASQNADRHFEEQAQQEAQEAEAEQQQQQDAETQRIEAERAKLQKEIDDIEGRALGPTFTTGMKENQIRLIQEKIDQLESNPEEVVSE
jgi:hypothetical protein